MPDRMPPVHRTEVTPERVNELGHMRAAEYVELFDDAVMALLTSAGLTDASLRHGATSPVLTELHATYAKEIGAGASIAIAAHVLGLDERRVHVVLVMREEATQAPVATCELAIVNISLESRAPVAWSREQAAIWSRLAAACAGLPRPPQVGRAIRPLSAPT
ncbi:MAG: thioesterase family protein [Hyphomicrobiaceae bacterium]|nr:thioesterase family protein [Hyphomicrobiaceae bacterium]